MLDQEKEYEPINGYVIKETAKAVLVRFKIGENWIDFQDRWVPRSLCENGDDLRDRDDDIRVEKWWLNKESLS